MGGEGAMLAASNSLKNNRNLVSKRKENKALEGSYANVKMKTFPKAIETDLIRIREKVQLANRKARIQLLVVYLVVLTVLILLSIYHLR
ncbi:hypothetical protein [Aestuariibaculum suncheonense]|uniref:Uncharacterized protein n=1 Tax=Aestuariibaculum suncheonense TaxID=1028745 RepID=A0A8J6ULH0_9FLAO|nr:hypothetical protein [Aestuariibaculum suncheonense]MBD0836371.1 hypothetical protein [Aestuariibaculum suncheonense]